jgi:hypothetical protein
MAWDVFAPIMLERCGRIFICFMTASKNLQGRGMRALRTVCSAPLQGADRLSMVRDLFSLGMTVAIRGSPLRPGSRSPGWYELFIVSSRTYRWTFCRDFGKYCLLDYVRSTRCSCPFGLISKLTFYLMIPFSLAPCDRSASRVPCCCQEWL